MFVYVYTGGLCAHVHTCGGHFRSSSGIIHHIFKTVSLQALGLTVLARLDDQHTAGIYPPALCP